MSKEQKQLSPVFFINFTRDLFKQREIAIRDIRNGNIDGAVVTLEYMEVVLADYLEDINLAQRQSWQTIDNCVKELIANDLPVEVQITHNQVDRFVKGATETLKKFFE